MPKVRLSALVADVKGKQGGSIWSSNSGGTYFRNNRNFGKQSSTRWDAQKAAFAVLAQSWRDLSENDRIEWNNAAPNFPTTNAFGEPRTPSGYELYMQLNGTLKKAKGTIKNRPPKPGSVQDPGTVTILQAVVGNIDVNWQTNILIDQAINIYAGAIVSPGRQFNRAKMKMMVTKSATGATTENIYAPWSQQFGEVPTSGRLYVMTESINMDTGQSGNIRTAFIDIGAPPVTGIGFMMIGSTFIVT